MPKTQDRQTARHERTRAEIVAAAWELAEQDGIAELSLRELAARVGMRAPSLYTYFPSKDAIYDAMFTEGYRQLTAQQQRTAATLDGTADAVTVMARHIEDFLGFCQASVPRYQLMFTRAIPGWEPSPEAYQASVDSFAQMVTALTDLGIEGEAAIDLFTATTSGLAAQQIANDPTGDRWVRLAGEAARMLLAHIRGEHPS